MGCGKSKHAVVATGNTITKNKSEKDVVANDQTSKDVNETTKEETMAVINNINNINATSTEDTVTEKEEKQAPSQEEQLQIQCNKNIATAAKEDINVKENNVDGVETREGVCQGLNDEIVEEKSLEVENKNDDGLMSKDAPKEHEAVAMEGSFNEIVDDVVAVVDQKETATTLVEEPIKEAEIGETLVEKQEETMQETNPSTDEKEQNPKETKQETNPSTEEKEQNPVETMQEEANPTTNEKGQNLEETKQETNPSNDGKEQNVKVVIEKMEEPKMK